MQQDFWELMKEKVEKKVANKSFVNLTEKDEYISDAAYKTILRMIENGDEKERCLGVKALGDSRREIRTLTRIVKEDSSEQVRAMAVFELSFYKDLLEVWNVLFDVFFNDNEEVVREEAERCLLRVQQTETWRGGTNE